MRPLPRKLADIGSPIPVAPEHARSGLKTTGVIGPLGTVLTLTDLPSPDTRRWTSYRKLEVAAAVRGELLSFDDALLKYRLSEQELSNWLNGLLRPKHGLYVTNVTGEQYAGFAEKMLSCAAAKDSIEFFGPLGIDYAHERVLVNGSQVLLTEYEYLIFELTVLVRPEPVPRGAYLDYLYRHRETKPEKKIIDVFICKLRKKLAAVGAPCIESDWGRGYRFVL